MNRRNWLAAVASLLPMSYLFFFKTKRATTEQENLNWGTYGKDACHWPHLKIKPLVDCDSDHLLAILETQHQITEEYTIAITNVLLDRGVSCKVISQRTSPYLVSKMSSNKSLQRA